jgi:hypothetical protein
MGLSLRARSFAIASLHSESRHKLSILESGRTDSILSLHVSGSLNDVTSMTMTNHLVVNVNVRDVNRLESRVRKLIVAVSHNWFSEHVPQKLDGTPLQHWRPCSVDERQLLLIRHTDSLTTHSRQTSPPVWVLRVS